MRDSRRSPHGRKAWIADVVWGLEQGLAGTSVLLLLVVVAAWVSGGRSMRSTGMTLTEVVLFYLFSGAAGGIVVGLCRRVLNTLLGVMVVGFLAALPAAGTIVLLLSPDWPLPRMMLVAATIAAALGPLVAVGVWRLLKAVE